MCRNIRPLNNFEPPATRDEVTARGPAVRPQGQRDDQAEPGQPEVFDRAVAEIAHLTQHLLDDLVTTAPPKDRDVEAAKARAARRAAATPDDPAADRGRTDRRVTGRTPRRSTCCATDRWSC